MLSKNQEFGKYRIVQLLGQGGFANVYRAYDTIEGIHVALKIPCAQPMTPAAFRDFQKEIRLTAHLDHPNILPIKSAQYVEDKLIVAYPLGESTLYDRLKKRLAVRTAVEYTEQMLEALAYAHARNIIHCDLKPENFILFDGGRLRLTDFGIARFAVRTIQASGSGTVGYLSPEQALGKPSSRSDVFSMGLIFYRMFAGHLPEWPFPWPPPKFEVLQRKVHKEFIAFLRKAMEVDPRKRYRNAEQMLQVFRRLRPQILRHHTTQKKRRRKAGMQNHDWQQRRFRQFKKRFGKTLEAKSACRRCGGPVSEYMHFCPWCRTSRKVQPEETPFPAQCPSCKRGMKLDWRFCPWCYSPGVECDETRSYSDKRYAARCANPDCRGPLMPFMRYCPWCHRKVRRAWKIEHSQKACSSCGWGVASPFWDFCAWCGHLLKA